MDGEIIVILALVGVAILILGVPLISKLIKREREGRLPPEPQRGSPAIVPTLPSARVVPADLAATQNQVDDLLSRMNYHREQLTIDLNTLYALNAEMQQRAEFYIREIGRTKKARKDFEEIKKAIDRTTEGVGELQTALSRATSGES